MRILGFAGVERISECDKHNHASIIECSIGHWSVVEVVEVGAVGGEDVVGWLIASAGSERKTQLTPGLYASAEDADRDLGAECHQREEGDLVWSD